MAVWTDLPPEIHHAILREVFRGRLVSHSSFRQWNYGYERFQPMGDITAVSLVGQQFITPEEAVAVMLNAARIKFTCIYDIHKLYARLTSSQRSAARTVVLRHFVTAPDYAEFGLKDLKMYFSGLQEIQLAYWQFSSHWAYLPASFFFFLKDYGNGDEDALELKAPFESKLAMYLYLNDETLRIGEPIPEILSGQWPTMTDAEARSTFDAGQDIEDGYVSKESLESMLARYWKDDEELCRFTRWRIALLIDSARTGVNVSFFLRFWVGIAKSPSGKFMNSSHVMVSHDV